VKYTDWTSFYLFGKKLVQLYPGYAKYPAQRLNRFYFV
jgi:hypothetical protein